MKTIILTAAAVAPITGHRPCSETLRHNRTRISSGERQYYRTDPLAISIMRVPCPLSERVCVTITIVTP